MALKGMLFFDEKVFAILLNELISYETTTNVAILGHSEQFPLFYGLLRSFN